MKKSLFILLAALCCGLYSCEEDATWPLGEEQFEHAYYIGFKDWGKLKNDVVATVNKNSTIEVAVQFYSEFVRDYDVITKYYVTNIGFTGTAAAVFGTDYLIVDSIGNTLSTNADGAFEMVWPNAIKGVKKIYIKNVSTKTTAGSFYLQFFNPADATGITITNRMNDSTALYTVSAFTQNYRCKIIVNK